MTSRNRVEGEDFASGPPTVRSNVGLLLMGMSAFFVLAVLVGLGTWQIQRLRWKLDLIARVDARVSASPLPPPPPAAWSTFVAEAEEYRHVRLEGRFLPGHDTKVKAVTELGGGSWVIAPFLATDGFIVLVNRGFVGTDVPSSDRKEPPEIRTITGLLRISEPRGAFLRHNDPKEGRWYSRDVAAIASADGIGEVAPYFIDADAALDAGGPVGGLTVVAFSNNHLAYALTWYGLAAMLVFGVVLVVRDERRLRGGAAR